MVADVIRTVFESCASGAAQEACFGNGAVEVTFRDTTEGETFENPGALAKLDSLARVRTNVPAVTDWGVVVLRPLADVPEATGDALSMLLLGDAEIINTYDPNAPVPACNASNLNAGNVNVHAQPDATTEVLQTLASQDSVKVAGIEPTEEWYGVTLGSELGWVQVENTGLDCERTELLSITPQNLDVLYPESMQQITLQTGELDLSEETVNGMLLHVPADEQARVLINNVQFDISGSVFLAADDNSGLRVMALEGETAVTARDQTVQLRRGLTTMVSTEGLMAADVPMEPAAMTEMGNLPDLLNGLVYGQPYAGPNSTVPGLSVNTAIPEMDAGGLVRVNLNFIGDACAIEETAPVDALFAVDISETLSETEVSLLGASVARFIDNAADRYAVVNFRSQSRVVAPLTSEFDPAEFGGLYENNADRIIREDVGLISAYNNGLATISTLLKGEEDETRQQLVILISDGTSDPEAVAPIVQSLKNLGTRIITVALGEAADQELLASIASNPETDALIADDALDLNALLEDFSFSVSRSAAANDFSLTYNYDPDEFEVLDALLPLSGGEMVEPGEIRWAHPSVFDKQIMEMPLVFRANTPNMNMLGEAEVSYDCNDGSTQIDGTSVGIPAFRAAPSENIDIRRGVIQPDEVGAGKLAAFEERLWVVDAGENETFSVVTSGDTVEPVIFGSTIEPLYTLDNFDGAGNALSVFSVEGGGPRWLYLQSTSAEGDYTVSIQPDIADATIVALEPDAAAIADRQENFEGRIYSLDGSQGDLLTFRYSGMNSTLPLEVVSLDGQKSLEVFSRFDAFTGQWISLQALQGAGPYRTVVKSNEEYEIAVEAGDTISDTRGELRIGDSLNQQVVNTNAVVVRYDLNVEEASTVSVTLTNGASAAALRDSQNQLVLARESVTVNNFEIDSYDLEAGTYNLYLVVTNNYGLDVETVSGTLSDAIGARKGTLLINNAIEERGLSTRINVYNLSPGAGKPLFDGDQVTIFLSNAPNASSNAVTVRSLDGTVSTISTDFSDDGRYISVHDLRGEGPYQVVVNGLTTYRINVITGDALSNDKGPLVIGQTQRDSSNAPEFLTYTLAPELGKQLVEGDVVTIAFQNRSGAGRLISTPVLSDAQGGLLFPSESFSFGAQFFGVYELLGSPPYKLSLPNEGAYTVSANIGNTVVNDAGELEIGETVGTTTGPQVIRYTFEPDESEVQDFTISVTSTSNSVESGDDLNVKITDADDEVLAGSFPVTSGNRIARVYTTNGNPPYTLEFITEDTYQIDVVEGDELRLNQGEFFLGDAEIVEVEEDDRFKLFTYTIEITEPTPLTIETDTRIFFEDPEGFLLAENYRLRITQGDDRTRYVYEMLEGTGTYTLSFFAFSETYLMSIQTSDLLTVDKGNVFFGVTEIDELQNEQRYATYALNAEEGEEITVRLDIDEFRRSRVNLDSNTLFVFDANGDPVANTQRIFTTGYLLSNYTLTGPAPYTLRVQPERLRGNFTNTSRPQSEYSIRVDQGDVSRLEMGGITLDEEIEGEVPDALRARLVRYDLTLRSPNQSITIDISPTSNIGRPSVFIEDENGNRVDSFFPTVSSTVRNVARETYELGEARTYTIEFLAEGSYSINIINDDIQTANFGTIAVNPEPPLPEANSCAQFLGRGEDAPTQAPPEGQEIEPIEIENSLTTDQVVAIYSIEEPTAEVITILFDGRLNSTPTFVDSAGEEIFFFDVTSGRDGIAYIYVLNGNGPYTFTARTNGRHTVRIDEGNRLITGLDPLELNPLEPPQVQEVDNDGSPVFDPDGNPVFVEFELVVTENQLEFPALVACHPIDLEADQTITLQVDQRDNEAVDFIILDANRQLVRRGDAVLDGGSLLTKYDLTGTAPYTILLFTTEQYSITLFEGDVLTAEEGELALGIFEEPFTNELVEPARVAIHTIDAQPGQLLTVQIEEGRRFVQAILTDANGIDIIPEIQDFQDDSNNVRVYLLSGSPPYQLRFSSLDEYQIIAVAQNLVRVDLGFATFGQPIEGELESPGRVVTYGIDGKRDELITISLQDGNDAVFGEFRDANGRLWQGELFDEQDNTAFVVYQIGGPPPYEITFNTEQTYNLTVVEGNALRSELGNVPLNEEVEGELEAPARLAAYTIPAGPGEEISVALQVGRRPAQALITNGDGQVLPIDTQVDKNNTRYLIYTLAGAEPYTLEFLGDNTYNLTVTEGNVLEAELGNVTLNEDIAETLESPAEVAIYTIDRQPGNVISIELADRNQAITGGLVDADGNTVEFDAEIEKNRRNFRVYTLTGSGPYTLSFTTLGRYNLRVSDGNVLRADQGVIRFGNVDTQTLEEPQEAAVYIIDALPGDVISLSLTDRNQPRTGELVDADGNEVLPFGRAETNNTAFGVFKLTGNPPYRYTFFPEGRYTLGLAEGNIFRTELGTIPFGSSVTNQLITPARIASYTINTEPDQIISITLSNNSREFVIPTLLNSEGEVIEPLAEVFIGDNEFTGVYLLQGTAPYTLEFETTNRYDLTLDRGNITEVELDPIGPEAPVPDEGGGPGGGGPGGGFSG